MSSTQVTIFNIILLLVTKITHAFMRKGVIVVKFDIKSPIVKKGLGIASALVMGVVAVSNALSDQKREKEFEDMKKAISELKSKE